MSNAAITTYVGLGSNLENPQKQLEQACEALSALPFTSFIGKSSWYRSKAVGPGEQSDYVNGVAKLCTCLAPMELLIQLHEIENSQGRERKVRWGARTLDLDLLVFGEEEMKTEDLELPHPRIFERNFVLFPLAELAPNLKLNGHASIAEEAKALGEAGLIKL